MNNIKTQKDFTKKRNEIYKLKDEKSFENRLRELYRNNSLKSAWKINQLRFLINDNKKFITYIGLVICNLVSAFATSIVITDCFDIKKEDGIAALLKTSSLMTAFGLIFLAVVLIIVFLTIFVAISTKYINRQNFEIDQITKSLNKSSLLSLMGKETKKSLFLRLIKDSVIGVTCGILATVIAEYHLKK